MAETGFGDKSVPSIINNTTTLPIEIPSYELIKRSILRDVTPVENNVTTQDFDWDRLESVIKKSLAEAQIKSLESVNQTIVDSSKTQISSYDKLLQEERDRNERRGQTLEQYNQQQLIKRLDSIIKWTERPISEQFGIANQTLNNPLSLIDKTVDLLFKPIQNLVGFGANKLQSRLINKSDTSGTTSGTTSSEVSDSIPVSEPATISESVVTPIDSDNVVDAEYTVWGESGLYDPIYDLPDADIYASPDSYVISDFIEPEPENASAEITAESAPEGFTVDDIDGVPEGAVFVGKFPDSDPAKTEREEGFMEAQAEEASLVSEVFSDPEGSEFGEFLDENLSPSEEGEKSADSGDPLKSLATMAIAAAVITGIAVLKDPLTNILDVISDLLKEVKGPFGQILQTVADVVSDLKDPIVDLTKTIIKELVPPIVDISKVILGTIKDVLLAIKDPIVHIAEFIGNNIVKVLDSLQPLIDEFLNEVVPEFLPMIRVVGNVIGAVGNILEPLSQLIEHLSGGVVKGAKNLWEKGTKWISEKFSVSDAIITTDGKVIETSPEDSIYAFKGDVSIKPVRENYSSDSSSYTTTQQSSVQQINQQYVMNTPFPAFSALAV